jgi:hypothetical protein
MFKEFRILLQTVLVTTSLVSCLFASNLIAQSPQSSPAPAPAQDPSSSPAQPSATTPPASAQPPATASKPAATGASHFQPDRFAGRAGTYYSLVWGVDSLSLKWTESGEVIRFSYRVVDANKAKALNNKKSEPFLIDPRAGVKLVVPSLENVGQLRQSSTPEAGKSYWMAFSNKGRLVKRGDHVSVVIGQFRAEGLVVD